MRLFVALHPPASVLEHLAGTVARLSVSKAAEQGINARVVGRHLWHITLAFLGEVPDERAVDAATALDRAAGSVAPMRLCFAGGGRFGRGRFTVLWVGVDGALAPLSALARSMTRELKRARLPYDPKPYRPHLTIARPGDRVEREALDGDLATLNGYRGPEWTVAEAVLMSSHLGPKPTHDRVHAAALSGQRVG